MMPEGEFLCTEIIKLYYLRRWLKGWLSRRDGGECVYSAVVRQVGCGNMGMGGIDNRVLGQTC